MKSWVWIRIGVLFLAIFAIGHTFGHFAGSRGDRPLGEQVVTAAMKAYHMDLIGARRSFYEFYEGMSLFLCVNLLVLMILGWQLSNLARTDPRRARPMVATLCLGCIAFTALCVMYFFAAPLIANALAAVCFAIAAALQK